MDHQSHKERDIFFGILVIWNSLSSNPRLVRTIILFYLVLKIQTSYLLLLLLSNIRNHFKLALKLLLI